MISVHAAHRKIILDGRIPCGKRPTTRKPKVSALKSVNNRRQFFRGRLWNYDASSGGFAHVMPYGMAKVPHTIQMADEIERPSFFFCKRRDDGCPNNGAASGPFVGDSAPSSAKSRLMARTSAPRSNGSISRRSTLRNPRLVRRWPRFPRSASGNPATACGVQASQKMRRVFPARL